MDARIGEKKTSQHLYKVRNVIMNITYYITLNLWGLNWIDRNVDLKLWNILTICFKSIKTEA